MGIFSLSEENARLRDKVAFLERMREYSDHNTDFLIKVLDCQSQKIHDLRATSGEDVFAYGLDPDLTVRYKAIGAGQIKPMPNGDWCDLCAAERVEMKAGEFRIISLGVAMQLPEGYEAHVLPRSSTFKRWGILMVNSMGIIDNSYCGDNDIWGFPALATRDTVIESGDRIAQFRIVKKMPPVQFQLVDKLGNEDRGGFGSSGVN